jgi:hypothetical protein
MSEGLSGKVTGVVVQIGELLTFESGFCKQPFRINVKDNGYDNLLEFNLLKDNVEKAKFLKVGQNAEVDFNIRAREHNGRVFTELVAWKVFGKADDASDPCARIEDADMPKPDAPF